MPATRRSAIAIAQPDDATTPVIESSVNARRKLGDVCLYTLKARDAQKLSMRGCRGDEGDTVPCIVSRVRETGEGRCSYNVQLILDWQGLLFIEAIDERDLASP